MRFINQSIIYSVRIHFEDLPSLSLTNLLMEVTKSIIQPSLYQNQSFEVIKFIFSNGIHYIANIILFSVIAWIHGMIFFPSLHQHSHHSINKVRKEQFIRLFFSISHNFYWIRYEWLLVGLLNRRSYLLTSSWIHSPSRSI